MKKFSMTLAIGLLLGLAVISTGVRARLMGPRTTAHASYPLNPPHLTFSTQAGSAVLEVKGGRRLFQHHQDVERPIASVTKMMTANMVLTHPHLYPPRALVTITAAEVANYERGLQKGDSEVPIYSGEKVSVQDLLWALMLPSADDAAWILADHYPGGSKAFIRAMNRRARKFSMDHTHYVDPDGVNHLGYSTASDLMRLTKQDMALSSFRRLVETKTMHTKFGTLTNLNRLLWTYRGATGIKTGWTPWAGTCLAFSASRRDLTLYGVVLGEPSVSLAPMFQDVTKLLNRGFQDVPWRTPVDAGAVVGEMTLRRGWLLSTRTVPLVLKRSLGAYALTNDAHLEVYWRAHVGEALQAGQVVGEARLKAGSYTSRWSPVVASTTVTVRWWERL